MAKRHRPLRLSFKKSSMVAVAARGLPRELRKRETKSGLRARSPSRSARRCEVGASRFAARHSLSCPCLPIRDRHSGPKPDSLLYTLPGLRSPARSPRCSSPNGGCPATGPEHFQPTCSWFCSRRSRKTISRLCLSPRSWNARRTCFGSQPIVSWHGRSILRRRYREGHA